MEFYSNTKPNLLATNIKNSFVSQNTPSPDINPFADKLTSSLMYILREYIEPNKLLIIIIISLVSYLYYCYDIKQSKLKEQKKNKLNQKENFHTFSPFYPINNNNHNINYLSDIIPRNKNTTEQNNQTHDFNQYFDHQNIQTDPTAYYQNRNTHTLNTPQNNYDTQIENPLGFSNNFVSSDDSFINQNNQQNMDAIDNISKPFSDNIQFDY
jgi:hypothetical protein